MNQTFTRKQIFIPNGAGWELELTRSLHPDIFQPNRRPVLMLPGFGNNSTVFTFPDNESSWESFLVHRGVEVWTANLRGQGSARFLGRRGGQRIQIKDLAVSDLGLVLKYIKHNTATSHRKIDIIGASLGGAMTYVHAVLQRDNHIGSIVSVGGPFRWEQCHPVVALAMSRPGLVGLVTIRGSRLFLQHTLPLLQKFPVFLRPYIQAHAIAGGRPEGLILAVDDPNRHLARQLAEWINTKDLIVEGVNLTLGMRHVTNPLLCATGNADGIVPPATSLAAIAASGASSKEVLWIGDDETPFGHTDPMIHREAPQRVFAPIEQWLQAQH